MGLRGERRSGHLDYFVLRHLGQQFGRSKWWKLLNIGLDPIRFMKIVLS
jgi:hypothetical protein